MIGGVAASGAAAAARGIVNVGKAEELAFEARRGGRGCEPHRAENERASYNRQKASIQKRAATVGSSDMNGLEINFRRE